MDKHSIYELQKIDCNCNDCAFMKRDFVEFQKWSDWNEKLQMEVFKRKREEAISEAIAQWNDWLSRKAHSMKFFFDTSVLLHYGICEKFLNPVSFMPIVCQIETQNCFVHRKDILS